MKYILTLERLGVNLECEKFADILLPVIEESNRKDFQFDINLIPTSFLKGSKITIKSFNIYFWDKNSSRLESQISNSQIKFDLYLSTDYNKKSIVHELQHMYQFLRNVKDGDILVRNPIYHYLYYSIQSRNVPITYTKDLTNLIFSIYFSLDDEIDARVQECYQDLKNLNTTKENFKENLLKTEIWQYPTFIEKSLKESMIEIRKNPLNYYRWFIYIRKNKLNNYDDKPFGDIFMSINKKYLELTKLKKIKKDNPLDTFLKIESFIESQNLKFKKKLYRMYDLF